ncbi:hypothetical protein EZV62_008695 [Acer yangbiense]|uniref:Glycosyltransferase 61 catalytic domain-containing protein n=1 Tax=Acer yangbiense TaxID=1000413 RepID=A0A5C7IDL9_9ROSI|nr:hypothetical protein EZV62_008695 [Acer yangbiense]
MSRKTSKLVKILLSLFAFNSLTLYFYFSSDSHHLHHNNSQTITPQTHHHHHHQQQQQFSKPWPILPSYLPWSSSQNPDVKFRSCEAYFGNGFQTRLDLLNSSSPTPPSGGGGGGGGWFRCFYSETLRSSVCEGGKVKMNVGKIKMSRGGERLEEVIGRTEEEEMPVFEDGAFEIDGDGDGDGKLGFGRRRLVSDEFLNSYLSEGEILSHTMRALIGSIRVVEPQVFDDCEQWVEEPTLLVTRFEYANLFHTVTDWYSAYVSSRVTGLPNRPHLVFVDGHCKTQLEETWTALFSSIRYAKNFSGSVCFRHAVLSPLGYETPLFKGLTEDINCHGAAAHDLWRNPDDRKTARLSEFGEMIRAAFGFQVNRHQTEKPGSGHNVLFVRREDYLAHPRHGGKVQSRLSNEQEVFDSIQRWVLDHSKCKINLINGLFAHMTMKEQVKHIQDASVIIGAHGAGLTHIVSATPKTVIFEIISSQFRRPHFQLIAQWKGLEYHAINLDGSYANPTAVIDKLSNIMRSLRC